MRPAAESGTVRADLARHTRADHEALHNHPWLSRLSQPGLSLPIYAAILRAYSALHFAIEAQRHALAVYPTLSLAPLCRALAADLDALPKHPGASLWPLPALREASDVLGALYVLQGARFGARSLRASVDRALPGAPRYFFDAEMPPRLWRDLVRALDAQGADGEGRARLLAGARRTFHAVGAAVSAACEESRATGYAGGEPRTQLLRPPVQSAARGAAPPPGAWA